MTGDRWTSRDIHVIWAGILQEKGQEKNVLVLVIRRVDFDANKKNAGHKINMTPRKIPSPEFSSLVNHGICGHLCADTNVLGLQVHLVYILVYFAP